jgi:hypothetical protein
MCASCDIQIARPHPLFHYCSQEECEPCAKVQSVVKLADTLHKKFRDRDFHYLACGSGRAVYVSPSGRFVYKVPLNTFGYDANLREHQIFRHKDLKHPVLTPERAARCRLAPSGVLVMEMVRTGWREPPKPLPAWRWEIDQGQIGLNRAGNWVAYDYGYE